MEPICLVNSSQSDAALTWLLDENQPGVHYLALQNVVGLPAEDRELRRARRLAHRAGQIAAILDAMQPDGFWVEPGAGYYPKYTGSVWSLITLAQLGARNRGRRALALQL